MKILVAIGLKLLASSREGMLAQLVEQRTFNPFVVGSTPAHPTKYALLALESLLLKR